MADAPKTDFIRQIIYRDLAAGKHPGGVVTRFPPEPNGFLHIGHAKSIVLNFGLAGEYAPARCHLRFDDTNPITENVAYVEAIQRDVRWLGYDWGEHLYFASDYFEAMYGFAEALIEQGLAYVDSSSEAEIRAMRGTVTQPGTPSAFRNRTPAENLDLFRRMRAGEFPDGAHVLRARIDLAHPNMIMRDPVLYRIRHAHHYRTGDGWCIYPLYDYAHCLEDALEGITHSLCTLEFENNREIYDWIIRHAPVPHTPRQYEFARLNLDYTVMSKRKLLRLVNEGHVAGWDDPRMPTIAGLRRRGVRPEAIRSFCEMIGVAKADSRVDMGKLEYAIRDDLNHEAPRVLAVLRPLRVEITNWPGITEVDPAGTTEWLDAPLWPRDVPREGTRRLPLSGEIFLDREDFAENPPKGFRRLVPGGAVRLRHGYVIRCDEVVRDAEGEVVLLRCRFDPETRSGEATGAEGGAGEGAGEGAGGSGAGSAPPRPDDADDPSWKPKTAIQWVSAPHAQRAQVRLYDRLFQVANPEAPTPEEVARATAGASAGAARIPEAIGAGKPGGAGDAASATETVVDFVAFLNPDSLEVLEEARVEPWVLEAPADTRFQFERLGYFWRDAGAEAASPAEEGGARSPLVFNRIVTLRDSWARGQAGGGSAEGGNVSAETSGATQGKGADSAAGGSPRGGGARTSPGDHPGGTTPAPPELSPEVQARADALAGEYGLSPVDAAILARDPGDEAFYRGAVAAWQGPTGSDAGAGALANWFIHQLPPLREGRDMEEMPLDPESFAALVALVEGGTLSSRGGGQVLEVMAREGGDPHEITRRLDLVQVSDDEALLPQVQAVVVAHPDKAAAYRGGKTGLMGFFMGQLMRATGGKADPERARGLLEDALGGAPPEPPA
jgi:glutaminyl-tRNA synthetase